MGQSSPKPGTPRKRLCIGNSVIFRFSLDTSGENSIGLKSLENLEIKCVRCHRLILSAEFIEGNIRSWAIIPEREFFILSLFSELQHF